MKKLLFPILFVVAAMLLLSACRVQYDEDTIYKLYDREWIVGHSREEIVRKYGEFDREYVSDAGEDVGAYYVNYENRGIDPSYIHDTYFILFEENGIATDSYFQKTSIGG